MNPGCYVCRQIRPLYIYSNYKVCHLCISTLCARCEMPRDLHIAGFKCLYDVTLYVAFKDWREPE